MQAPTDDVLGPDVVMSRHDQVRELGLRRSLAFELPDLGRNPVGAEIGEQIDLRLPRGRGAVIGEVDDCALVAALDRRMRVIDEAGEAFREPVIAAREARATVHALLHDGPLPIGGQHETVQIEIEPILQGGAVHLRHQPAGAREGRAVDADAIADRGQLVRRAAGMRAAAAADIETEFVLPRAQSTFERADHAGGDAGGMPVPCP